MNNRYLTSAKAVLMSVLLFVFCLVASADSYTYQDSWGKQGLTLTSNTPNKVELNVSVNNFTLEPVDINGEQMQEIAFDGFALFTNAGEPNIPGISRLVAIPQGATASLEIIDYRVETIQNVNIAPSPVIPKENEDGLVFSKSSNVYNRNAFFPENITTISEVKQLRGVDVVLFNISPFAYNPVTKELKVYRDIKARITFNGGNGQFGDNRLRSKYFDPILMDNIVNSSSLPAIDYNERNSNITRSPMTTGCEYLIIVPNDPSYRKWADSLRVFRTEQGISTNVVSLSEIGGNSINDIKNYIVNAYNTWDVPPVAILFLGDYGSNAQTNITSPIHNNYCVSDNMFADINNDNMPDIVTARMTANNEEQVKTFVTKTLEYERTPPTTPGFYNNPITALGWQTERWFQICSEVVGGYFKHVHGKDPVRINAIYSGTPGSVWSTATNTSTVVNYFGPNGLGYIPATPSELGGWTGGNSTMVTNAINSGAFLLQHRDHGMETGWGEPDYTNNNINDLNNVGKMSFILSFNCLTGKYNYSGECFAEKFHRHKYGGLNAGAVGVTAASEVSYSFVNDTYAWGFFDMMWPDFMPDYGQQGPNAPRGIMPAFANVAGKYFLQQSSWPYNTQNKLVTYHLFHHHGDAFLELFSEMPQNLTVMHPDVMIEVATSIGIKADEGSHIALTHNGQILATATGTGNILNVNFTPPAVGQKVKVVVTKTNHYRHTSYFLIISADDPYIITDSYTINDVLGNNNNVIDFDETVFLSLAEKNLGNTDAHNVTVNLTGGDNYINIIDGTELYPSIPSKQTVTIADGFKIKISDDVPDQYTKILDVTATDGSDTWESHISVTCNAPSLYISEFTIDDSQGGNGNNRLDPGETAVLKVKVGNSGHSLAENVVVNISLTTGLIILENNTYVIDNINPMGTKFAEFTLSVNPNAPTGMKTDLITSAVCGKYNASKTFILPIGLLVEDWETGDFSKFEWQHGGNKNWTITNVNPYEGNFSAKSGEITHYQSSQLILQYNFPVSDSISFMYKVSTETSGDGLKFFVDNVLQETFHGITGWNKAVFPIEQGQHMLKWIYYKNGSGSAGEDCAWLDFINFPLEPKTSCYAGFDGFVCENDNFLCQGEASNYSSVEWTTTGTGTFNNNTILKPIYTPSSQDIADGGFILILTVQGTTGTAVDSVSVTVQHPSTAYAGQDGNCCSNSPYDLLDATADNYTSLLWTTSGTGTFSDKYALNPSYTASIEDATAGSVVLTLNASNESCAPTSSEMTLNVTLGPNPAITGDEVLCAMNETVYSTPLVAGNNYQWEVPQGTIIEGQGTNTITVVWDNNTSADAVSVTETNSQDCSTTVTKNVTINANTSPEISGNLSTCKNDTETYYTPFVEGNTYNWEVSGGNIVSGQGTNQIEVNWDVAGDFTLSITEGNQNCETTVVEAVEVKEIITSNPDMPTGPSQVDLYFGLTTDVSVTPVPEANAYEWEITPANAGTITSTESDATINWENDFRGTAKIKVKATNACSESQWSEELPILVTNTVGVEESTDNFRFEISPNPNSGNFKLTFVNPEANIISIRIINMAGSIVYQQKNIETNGKYINNLNLNLNSGAYTVIVSDNKTTSAKKLIIK
ncbi:MAG: C25 family cysteine peptidase [Bacteroidales bacterium]|jgi:hypothetical protein